MAYTRSTGKSNQPEMQRFFRSHRLSALFGPRVATLNPYLMRILAVVGMLAILTGGWLHTGAPPPATSSTLQSLPDPPVGFQVGDMAPNFTLTMPADKRVSLSDFRGKPVVLNFWYAASLASLAETPSIQTFYVAQQASGKDVVILSVNIADDASIVREFVQHFGVTYMIGLDDHQRVATLYHLEGIPTSYFIDRQGTIRSVVVGPVDEAKLQQYVAQIKQ